MKTKGNRSQSCKDILMTCFEHDRQIFMLSNHVELVSSQERSKKKYDRGNVHYEKKKQENKMD